MITLAAFALVLGTSFAADVERVTCPDYARAVIYSSSDGPGIHQPSSQAALFPSSLFVDPDLHLNDGFVCHWYSEVLEALDEDALTADTDSQYLRFTWLRSFHAPMTFRVAFSREGGDASLIWKAADGRGGYGPGEIANWGEIGMPPNVQTDIEKLLTSMPICRTAEDPTRHVDGAQWIFELANDREYCFHEVQSPSGSAEYALGRMLIDLSGIDIPEEDIY